MNSTKAIRLLWRQTSAAKNTYRICVAQQSQFQADETMPRKKYNKSPPIDLKRVNSRGKQDSGNYDNESASSGDPITAAFFLSIPLITFGLGVWQVKRREWKIDLIEFLDSRTKAEPRPLPTDPKELANLVETNEYYPFKVKGRFIHSQEILLAPRSDLTGTNKLPGGVIITPFELSDRPGTRILINRGYVPYTNFSPMSRLPAQIDTEVEIVGLLRSDEPLNSFTPENRPDRHEWHHRNIGEIASYLNTLPIYLDANEASSIKGGPLGGQTAINLRNEHMSYIVTWFTLSVLTTFLWYKRFARVFI